MTRTVSFACLALLAGSFSAAVAQDSRPSGASGAQAVTVPTFHNTNCPIMGKPVSTKLFVDTVYGRIYICCKGCVKKIQADPATAYKAAYPTTKKLDNKICPVTGEAVDGKSTVTVQGHEVALCCADCAKGVQENSLVVLARLTNPKVVDLNNTTCPVTGKPVQNNAFVLIGDDLVHLSSPECVEQVQKDPKKVLEKARAGKGGEKPKDSGTSGHQHGGPDAGPAAR